MEIVRDTFGDWQVRCSPEGNECFIYQLGLDAEKNPVAEVSILKLPLDAEADAGVTIVTPLGTLLPSGVAVQIDNGQPRQYPFAWCSQVGCFARFGLDRPSIDSMKRGKTGKVVLHAVAAPEQPMTLVLSLTGFTAAFDSLDGADHADRGSARCARPCTRWQRRPRSILPRWRRRTDGPTKGPAQDQSCGGLPASSRAIRRGSRRSAL